MISKHLYIVGAGFSANAGLPLASNFTQALLRPTTALKPTEANAILNNAIRRFVDDAFGGGAPVSPSNWPELEDIFTTIDLAANTGHHLGLNYSAGKLRTIRRALIVRFMRMLRIAYNEGQKKAGENWDNLSSFLSSFDISESAFLSLNWDTVIESGLAKSQSVNSFDYGCGAIAAEFNASHAVAKRILRGGRMDPLLLKPHGSVNWMYCDCCSRMFWFQPKQTALIASRLFKQSDSDALQDLIGRQPRAIKAKALCPACKAEALGTRFATFSYRKALDFPMHLATWQEAERQLRCSANWVFIGYSLPAADFEFKFLLKRVQLSRPNAPNIVVITAGGAQSETLKNYRKFFGAPTIPPDNAFVNGLDQSALSHLRSIGALGPS